ncbi:MAG: hypothetical protein ACYCPW_08095 [Nitrososphaerales archaeon]
MDSIEFSKHSVEQMRVRNVSKQHITMAIRNPDSSYEDIKSNATVAGKTNMLLYCMSGEKRIESSRSITLPTLTGLIDGNYEEELG